MSKADGSREYLACRQSFGSCPTFVPFFQSLYHTVLDTRLVVTRVVYTVPYVLTRAWDWWIKPLSDVQIVEKSYFWLKCPLILLDFPSNTWFRNRIKLLKERVKLQMKFLRNLNAITIIFIQRWGTSLWNWKGSRCGRDSMNSERRW